MIPYQTSPESQKTKPPIDNTSTAITGVHWEAIRHGRADTTRTASRLLTPSDQLLSRRGRLRTKHSRTRMTTRTAESSLSSWLAVSALSATTTFASPKEDLAAAGHSPVNAGPTWRRQTRLSFWSTRSSETKSLKLSYRGQGTDNATKKYMAFFDMMVQSTTLDGIRQCNAILKRTWPHRLDIGTHHLLICDFIYNQLHNRSTSARRRPSALKKFRISGARTMQKLAAWQDSVFMQRGRSRVYRKGPCQPPYI